MNKYLIEQKIKTLSELWLDCDGRVAREMAIDGFVFNQWREPQGTGLRSVMAWMVKKEIESDNCINALNTFRRDLDTITQKVGFVSQCYMDFFKEPFLLFKLSDNNDRLFLYQHTRVDKGVGLHFGNNELQAYEQIKDFKYPEAFRFLRECRNTIGYIPKLLLLFSALEAMCGRVEIDKGNGKTQISYEKETMMKILGRSLYNELFGPSGIRHKLDHGEMVELVFGKNYVDEIYKNIVCYFNTEFKANISEEVVSPQRHFYDNVGSANLWLKPENNFSINLINLVENCDDNLNVNGCRYVPDLIDPEKY